MLASLQAKAAEEIRFTFESNRYVLSSGCIYTYDKARISNKPWNERLEEFRLKGRRLSKHHQRTLTEGERMPRLQAYRQVKKDYQQQLWNVKVKSWDTFVENYFEVDPWRRRYKIVSQKILHLQYSLPFIRAKGNWRGDRKKLCMCCWTSFWNGNSLMRRMNNKEG